MKSTSRSNQIKYELGSSTGGGPGSSSNDIMLRVRFRLVPAIDVPVPSPNVNAGPRPLLVYVLAPVLAWMLFFDGLSVWSSVGGGVRLGVGVVRDGWYSWDPDPDPDPAVADVVGGGWW